MKVVIINTGVGNVRSVSNMLRRMKDGKEIKTVISHDPEEIGNADALVIPGVGSFDAAMTRLGEHDLQNSLEKTVLGLGTPVLGLCLGMQIMAEGSEEGNRSGLGWFPGRLEKLRPAGQGSARIRVPHMGWNIITETRDNVLYDGMGEEVRFYFDHSFYFRPDNEDFYCGKVNHGLVFAAGIRRENIFGVQYHPEKSHRFGLALFENFIRYAAVCPRKPVKETT